MAKKPISIVSLEDEENRPQTTSGEPLEGVSFWFGEKGAIPFDDGTKYLALTNREFITDEKLIKNLRLKAKQDASYKIIEEVPSSPSASEESSQIDESQPT